MTFRITVPNNDFSSPMVPLATYLAPELVAARNGATGENIVTPTMIKQAYIDFVNSLRVRISPKDPNTFLVWHPGTTPDAFYTENGLVVGTSISMTIPDNYVLPNIISAAVARKDLK